MTFIISFTRSIRELIFAYAITLVCILFCYYQCPPENHYQVHIAGMFTRLYDSNLILSPAADHLLLFCDRKDQPQQRRGDHERKAVRGYDL